MLFLRKRLMIMPPNKPKAAAMRATVRPEGEAPTASQGKYLQAVCRLSQGGLRPVRQRDVVRYLGCSKPSVSRAVSLLRQPPCWPPEGRSVRRRGGRGSTHARQMDS